MNNNMNKVVIKISQGSAVTSYTHRVRWATCISSSYKVPTVYVPKLWKVVESNVIATEMVCGFFGPLDIEHRS